MQNANCKMQKAKWGAEGDARQNAKCKMQNPKLEARMTIETRSPNSGVAA
jgi:hypothetical protein